MEKPSGVAVLVAALGLIALQCGRHEPPEREPWIDKPLQEWPSIALTNDVTFHGKAYKKLANSFLVSAPPDTFAVRRGRGSGRHSLSRIPDGYPSRSQGRWLTEVPEVQIGGVDGDPPPRIRAPGCTGARAGIRQPLRGSHTGKTLHKGGAGLPIRGAGNGESMSAICSVGR